MTWKRRRRPDSPPLDRGETYDAAIAILALRPHLEAELATKLALRGAPHDVVAEVLADLRDRRLVDDAQVSRRLATETSTNRRWGAHRVKAELRQRGADDAVVTAALAELDDPLELARRAAERWSKRRPGGLRTPNGPARLARHLSGLGHPADAIAKVLAELRATDAVAGDE